MSVISQWGGFFRRWLRRLFCEFRLFFFFLFFPVFVFLVFTLSVFLLFFCIPLFFFCLVSSPYFFLFLWSYLASVLLSTTTSAD